MQSNQTFGETSPSLRDKVGGAVDDGLRGLSDSAVTARDAAKDDLKQLREDFAGLSATLTRFISESSGEAATTAKKVGSVVSEQLGVAASGVAQASADMAANASEQVKTFASELEGFAKRQPLGALAGALLAGVVIGLVTRGRG